MLNAERIMIAVMHRDPIAQGGLRAAFDGCVDLQVQQEQESTSPDLCDADVVVADYLGAVALLANAQTASRCGKYPRVVIVAGIDREWEIKSALEIGARGYLLEGCSLQELADGVRAVHRGSRHLSPQVAARLAESCSVDALTGREEEVLRLVVEGHCNKAIAKLLKIAVGTVKSHLKATFGKLDVDSRTQAIAVAGRRGMLAS